MANKLSVEYNLYIMRKEWLKTVRQHIEGRFNETARNATFAIGVRSFARGLSPEATPLYQDMVRRLLTGDRVVISELTGLLHGYDVHPSGLEYLEGLSGKPFILVTNHFNGGPLRGFWQVVNMSHFVREKTGQEPRWVQGSGHHIVSHIHDMVASATNNIAVGGVGGVREIERTLRNGVPIAIHPEGQPSRTLTRGDPRAGRILLNAAEKDIPILCCAAWSEQNNLFVTMSALSPDSLRGLGNRIEDVRQQGQHVVDYVMGALAQNLPKKLRGYYLTQ